MSAVLFLAMSKADQIRHLKSLDQSVPQISATLSVSRSYVYAVLSRGRGASRHQALLEAILREIREMRSEIRLALKQARHPVDRRLERLG